MAAFEPLVAATISNARSKVLADPYSAESWGLLGYVLDAHAQYEPAATCYAQASARDPSDFRWVYLHARIEANLGQSDEIALFKTALKLRPDYLALRLRLADALVRENRLDEAQQQYRSALELDSENPLALLGLGQVAFSLGGIDEAHQYLRRCQSIRPDWKRLQSLLARVLRQQGNLEAAHSAAEWAGKLPVRDAVLLMDPVAVRVEEYGVSAIAFANRGLQAILAGDLEGADREFSMAVKLRPDVASRHYNMGKLRARQGRVQEAVEAYQEAIRLEPGYSTAHCELGVMFNRIGNQEGALEHFRATIELQPTHAHAYQQLGLLLAARGEPEQALAVLRQAVELEPDNLAYAQDLAVHLQQLPLIRDPTVREGKRWEGEAIKVLRNALSIHRGNPQLSLQLAWILATSPDETLRDGEEALALVAPIALQDNTTDLQLQVTLAAALGQVGRFDDALAIVDQIQSRDRKGAGGLYPPLERVIQQMGEQFKKGEAFHR